MVGGVWCLGETPMSRGVVGEPGSDATAAWLPPRLPMGFFLVLPIIPAPELVW